MQMHAINAKEMMVPEAEQQPSRRPPTNPTVPERISNAEALAHPQMGVYATQTGISHGCLTEFLLGAKKVEMGV